MPATPNVAHISPSGMLRRNPERTERTQMIMLIDQSVTERSQSDGTMRIGIPIAIISPCFQSMLLTNWFEEPSFSFLFTFDITITYLFSIVFYIVGDKQQ